MIWRNVPKPAIVKPGEVYADKMIETTQVRRRGGSRTLHAGALRNPQGIWVVKISATWDDAWRGLRTPTIDEMKSAIETLFPVDDGPRMFIPQFGVGNKPALAESGQEFPWVEIPTGPIAQPSKKQLVIQ